MKITNYLICKYIFIFLLGCHTAFAETNNQNDAKERRVMAVKAAHENNFDVAIPELKSLSEENPNDIGILSDYIVALCWSSNPKEAVKVAGNRLDPETAPIYAIKFLARAERDIGNFSEALYLYQKLIVRDPDELDFKIGKVLTLTDSKDFNDAEIDLNELMAKFPGNSEVMHTFVYYAKATGQYAKVIDTTQRLIEKNPNDNVAKADLVIAASEIGAPGVSQSLIEKYSDALTEQQKINVQGDEAAQSIRWGVYDPIQPELRYHDTDKGLSQLDQACKCDWNNPDLTKSYIVRLVCDRMLALRDRMRMKEVVDLYLKLKASNVEIPPYALNSAADAYLVLHEPEKALEIYETSLSKRPNHFETLLSKFYTLIELERFDDAILLIDELASEQPAYLQRQKNPIIRENDKRFQSDNASNFARAYADDLKSADERFTKMYAIGPSNIETQQNLASIWRWRGWPERAERSFNNLITEEPDNDQSHFGLANSLLDLRDYRASELELNRLSKYISPEDSDLKKLARRWELYNRRELNADFTLNQSSGTVFGKRSNEANVELFSSPINYNYRAFLDTRYDQAQFPEGNGAVTSPNLGIEYRDRDWKLTGELGYLAQDSNGITAKGTAQYRVDDYLSFNGDLSLNSFNMPLRGARVGTKSDEANIGAVYRWSELMNISGALGIMKMDDGNLRISSNATFERRLLTTPHYKLTGEIVASISSNNKTDVLYYNPMNDHSLGLIADNEWVTWRRYDRSFTQRLQLGIGSYWEQGFGSSGSWFLSYSHEWEFDKFLRFAYGIGRYEQSYDGKAEYRDTLFGSLNLLF